MDISSLARLYEVGGPFVTVYLGTPSDVPNAAQQHELRWRNLLRDLEERGVDQATRAALDAHVGPHDEGDTRVLVAAPGRVVLALSLPELPAQEVAVTIGPLPALLPLLVALSARVPHLVVLADRVGADIAAYAGIGEEPAETASVQGEDFPIRKVGPGGWSQRRFQAAVEETWEHNAKDVAETIGKVALDISAQLILAAGDERALVLIRDNLPAPFADYWTTVTGTRHADGGDPFTAAAIAERLAEYRDAQLRAVLEKFGEERGQGDAACEGAADTVAALRMAQVGTLLLTDRLDFEGTAWLGPQLLQLGLAREELTAMGVESPERAPLGEALLRAALGSDAEVRFVPAEDALAPRDGVGGLLRYTTETR